CKVKISGGGSGGIHCRLPGNPERQFQPAAPLSRYAIGLALIAIAAAAPRLLLGSAQFIGYDGFWHVFIAQQDRWPAFWADIYANAHPPLFFLLLKPVLHLGHSLLVYRSISLMAWIASVFPFGWIAHRVLSSDVRAWQSTLVYGLAMPGIIMSCEVRSY